MEGRNTENIDSAHDRRITVDNCLPTGSKNNMRSTKNKIAIVVYLSAMILLLLGSIAGASIAVSTIRKQSIGFTVDSSTGFALVEQGGDGPPQILKTQWALVETKDFSPVSLDNEALARVQEITVVATTTIAADDERNNERILGVFTIQGYARNTIANTVDFFIVGNGRLTFDQDGLIVGGTGIAATVMEATSVAMDATNNRADDGRRLVFPSLIGRAREPSIPVE